MDLKKTWSTMLVLVLIAVIVWVGFSIYFKATDVSVDPNASTYIQYISPHFNLTGLTKVIEKTKDLPVTPGSFRALVAK